MSRFDYVKYDEGAAAQQAEAKSAAIALEAIIEKLNFGLPTIAKTRAMQHLEETYMWIGKEIRDEQILRNGEAPLQEERTNE